MQMSQKAPLLEMKNIQKDFFGNQVLTDINLTLQEGEVLGLVGENGAGKSTLMKILFGMDVIRDTGGYGGTILLNGETVDFKTPFEALAAGIGMVHQEFSLIPGFTATENILLNREPKKKSVVSEIFGERLDVLNRKEMNRKAESSIDKMGVKIDDTLNEQMIRGKEGKISTDDSTVAVYVIPTNEELVIARDTMALVK